MTPKTPLKKINKEHIILAVILLLTLAVLILHGFKKQGYHIDEMYMYGTANSEYLPFMHMGAQEYSVKDFMHEYGTGANIIDAFKNLAKDIGILRNNGWHFGGSEIATAFDTARANSNETYTTTWMSGQDYIDYLSVNRDSRFNYFSVMYNFHGENHPPLYAMLLHTVCSFFPGVFSKWFGIGLDAVIVLCTVMLLYLMVKKSLGGTLHGLITAAVYGFSMAAAASATFIRMYVLFIFMTVGMCHAHLSLHGNGWKLTKKIRWMLILYTLFGYLTQFYFVFFAFPIAIVSAIIIVARKQFKDLLSYILTLGLTAVAGLILWPFSLLAVFKGSRGSESIGGLFSSGSFDRFRIMFDILARETLSIPGWLYLTVLLIVGGIAAFFMIQKRKKENSSVHEKVLILCVPFVFYFVTVSKMIPYLTDRYIMCLFPLCFVFVISGAALLLKYFKVELRTKNVAMLVLGVLLILLTNSLHGENPYWFRSGQETDTVPENTDCLYILPPGWWNQSTEDAILLSRCRNSAVTQANKIEEIYGSYNPDAVSSFILVLRDGVEEADYVPYVLDNIQTIKGKFSFTEVERKHVRETLMIRYSVSTSVN
ncbi:MAG: hypothetical protein K5796_08460 [Lachnospiraceae bacterium]|nr:hypothetical protein [Lachnospiraceae bacterium]